MPYNYPYPHPALTVDAILFAYSGNTLKVLFIQRGIEPFKGKWAFPGGFVEENETVEDAVKRELKEEVSLSAESLQQFYTASAPGRDPRGWTVSVVFIGFVGVDNVTIKAGDDATNAKWFPLNRSPELAFDHDLLLMKAKHFLNELVNKSVIDDSVLPSVFLLEQLHSLYFEITGSAENTELLIKRLIEASIVVQDTYQDLYKFNKANYNRVLKRGFY